MSVLCFCVSHFSYTQTDQLRGHYESNKLALAKGLAYVIPLFARAGYKELAAQIVSFASLSSDLAADYLNVGLLQGIHIPSPCVPWAFVQKDLRSCVPACKPTIGDI